jgi:hypothetical protein
MKTLCLDIIMSARTPISKMHINLGIPAYKEDVKSVTKSKKGVKIRLEAEDYTAACSNRVEVAVEQLNKPPQFLALTRVLPRILGPKDLVARILEPKDLVARILEPKDLVARILEPKDLVAKALLPALLVQRSKLLRTLQRKYLKSQL